LIYSSNGKEFANSNGNLSMQTIGTSQISRIYQRIFTEFARAGEFLTVGKPFLEVF